VYATLLSVIFVAGLTALLLRNPLALDVMRDRNALYRQADDGGVENVYNLRLMNKDKRDHVLTLAVEGIEGARLAGDRHEWLVKSGEVYAAAVAVDVPAGAARGGHDVRFTLSAKDDPGIRVVEKARFIAP
jgi:polyferredoxin